MKYEAVSFYDLLPQKNWSIEIWADNFHTNIASLLPAMLIFMFVSFICWPNIAIPLEGQNQMPSIKITSPTPGENISTAVTWQFQALWQAHTS